jgi:hypothetical protein
MVNGIGMMIDELRDYCCRSPRAARQMRTRGRGHRAIITDIAS